MQGLFGLEETFLLYLPYGISLFGSQSHNFSALFTRLFDSSLIKVCRNFLLAGF